MQELPLLYVFTFNLFQIPLHATIIQSMIAYLFYLFNIVYIFESTFTSSAIVE